MKKVRNAIALVAAITLVVTNVQIGKVMATDVSNAESSEEVTDNASDAYTDSSTEESDDSSEGSTVDDESNADATIAATESDSSTASDSMSTSESDCATSEDSVSESDSSNSSNAADSEESDAGDMASSEVNENEIMLEQMTLNGYSNYEIVKIYGAIPIDGGLKYKAYAESDNGFEIDTEKTVVIKDVSGNIIQYKCKNDNLYIVDLPKGETTMTVTLDDGFVETDDPEFTYTFIYYDDTNNPEITDYKIDNNIIATTDDKNVYLASGPVDFTIDASDVAKNEEYEYASGVESVTVNYTAFTYDNGNTTSEDKTCTLYPDNNGKCTFTFSENGEYLIKDVYAVDKCGNPKNIEDTTKSINKYIYIENLSENEAEYVLTAGNWRYPNISDSNANDWYSKSKYGDETLTVTTNYYIYGKSSSEDTVLVYTDDNGEHTIEPVSVNVSGNYEWGSKSQVTATFEIDANVEQNRDYVLRYKYFCNETNEKIIPIHIDNTAPTGTFMTSFVANTDNYYVNITGADVQSDGNNKTYTYTIGAVDGEVITKDNQMTLNIYSSDANDLDGSGISNMKCTYTVDDTDNEVSGNYVTDGDTKVMAQITVDKKDGLESTYKIKNVILADYAGNEATLPVNEAGDVSEDKVSYDVDSLPPRIEYSDVSGEIFTDIDGTLFFDKKVTAPFSITDKNLDTKSVEVKAIGDCSKPTLSEGKVNGNVYNYSLIFKKDGTYEYYLYAKDMVSNEAKKDTKKVVIDSTDPVIDIKYSSASGNIDASGTSEGYTNKDVTVTVNVTEENIADDGLNVVIRGTDINGNDSSITLGNNDFTRNGDTYSASYKVEAEGTYTVTATAADKCGHTAEAEAGEFTLDKTAPTIEVSFDNDNAINGYYYNSERTATINVQDYTFDKKNVDFNVNSSSSAPSLSDWSGSDNEFTATVKFSEDGKYSFSICVTDKAGNKSEVYESDEFFIDRTEPKISISFDNNTAANQIYYKAKRTATINIEEISFDDSTVTVTPIEEAGLDSLPQISSFSGSDESHTATMTFDADGKYGFVISCKDLAGNESETVTSEVFVIDTTVPEVTITGVTDKSANNGVVAPVINYIDKNIDTDGTVIQTVGKNNGDTNVNVTVTPITDGFSAQMSDLPHEKKYDDLYVLTADVFDLAGNETKEEIMFSVNRFGSVYVIDDTTAALIADYYTNVPPEVSITEINLDELEWKNVSVGRDGEISELKAGKDYSISESEDDKSWNAFTYTVKAENFYKDGNYSVVISSKDAATNEQDNVIKDAEVEFAVDTTEPGIAVSGLEDGGIYEEETHLISFNVTDNMGIVNAAVYDDDKLLYEYTDDELQKDGYTEQVELVSADKSRTIRIVSTDVAGNEATAEYEDIIVSLDANAIKKAEEQLPDVLPDVKKQDEEDIVDRNTTVPVIPIAGGSTAAVVGGYALVEFIKKKKLFK